VVKKIFLLAFVIISLFLIGCRVGVKKIEYEKITNIKYAGVRASIYGVKPFPAPEKWKDMIFEMKSYFPSSKPVVIWIVGIVKDKVNCRLHFPSDGKTYKNIIFDKEDLSEKYLDYFDKNGIDVFLQVEPADADVGTLMRLVLNRYGHNECVVGFGIDVEWYRENSHRGWGQKVDDETAKKWEEMLKKYNPNYKLFIKHWDLRWMPENYRGDIIFVDDSQQFKKFEQMKKEFAEWGKNFYPNEVWFQIGYPADKKWWNKFRNPPKLMGYNIASEIKQNVGILWVDFSLKDLFY